MCGYFWTKWNENKAIKYINDTDIIFTGNLITFTDDCYEFKVIKVYKGEAKKNDIIDGYYKTSCSGYPNIKGKWIFYGNYDDTNNDGNLILDYHQCGPTKNIDFDNNPKNRFQKARKKYWTDELNLLNFLSKKE